MKILYATPNSTDAMAFYRGSLPLSQMGIDYTISKQISWSELKRHDLVFVQRPHSEDQLELVKMAKKWGLPVVVDFDDWLCDLPRANPAHHVFEGTRETFFEVMKLADGIMTATDHLANKCKEHNPNVVVVPNAYDSKLFSYAAKWKERTKVVLWRGGNSHLEDLMNVKEDHDRLIKENPDWLFVFVAQDPWWLKPAENLKHIGGLGIIEFMQSIYDMAPAIMHHPLTDCDFNRSKSMCSWLEATHARAAFVGPDFEEFKRPGIVNYSSLYESISELINNTEKIGKCIDESTKYIHENLTLKIVNKKRLEFFNAIVNNR